MDKTIIDIPTMVLEWSKWFNWEDFNRDLRSDTRGVKVPDDSGVYEARYINSDKSLTIGKASNLRMRIKQGLVKGKVPHSAGKRIRVGEDLERIEIRWALTNRPSAVEEELHLRYVQKHGVLPIQTKRT